MTSATDVDIVRDILPQNFKFKIKHLKINSQSETNLSFESEIRVSVKTESEVNAFLAALNTSSGCTFNIMTGYQDKRQDALSNGRALSKLRGFRKCCMRVAKEGETADLQPGKNTNCGAGINFRLENPVGNKSVREERENYPLWIKIKFDHNHSLNRAEYYKYLSVSQETAQYYTDQFSQGLLPGSAHARRKQFIKSEYPDSWPLQFADRSVLPSIFWVYNKHRQFMDKAVGSRDGIDAYEKAEELIKEYDTECKKTDPLPGNKCYARIAQSEEGETAVVIVDPFMYRVHNNMPQSGDIVMVDATSNLDRNDCKLIHMVCPSPIGALPLADIIVTREDEITLSFAFNLLKTVLPEKAFYGRGVEAGPKIIMTDDCDAERQALAGAWPCSVLLLCIFHVLQALWTWVWNQKNKIENKDRQVLLLRFRAVLYAETQDELADHLENMYADEIVSKYPQFVKHLIRDIFPKMKAWSLERRISECLPTGNNNTNNLVESSFRYVKDILFNRIRAFNLTEMVSIILDRSEWYVNKAIDAANNRIETWLKNTHSKYVGKECNIDPDKIMQPNPPAHIYIVPSETSEDISYLVDIERRVCSCPKGRLTGPCKHKEIITKYKQIPSFDVLPTSSPHMRQKYMFLATGQDTPLDWFLPLQDSGAQEAQDSVRVEVAEELDMNENVTQTQYLADVPENNSNDVKTKLKKALDSLAEKVMKRIDHDSVGYSKAVAIFEKTVDKLPSTVDSALQKSLCSFGKSITQVMSSPILF